MNQNRPDDTLSSQLGFVSFRERIKRSRISTSKLKREICTEERWGRQRGRLLRMVDVAQRLFAETHRIERSR